MSLDKPKSTARCPALCRASLLVLAMAVSACASYYPQSVDGLSDDRSWLALPLRRWLADDRAEPEAVAICLTSDCGSGMVVSVVRTRGKDADEAETILKAPERLARALETMRDRKSKVRTVASVRKLESGAVRGFLLTLARADGERPAFGAALASRTAEGLRIVLAIGSDPNEVEATARRVAAKHLGS